MANINITQIRMKRGNTAASSTYTGPLGELLVDTGLKTIRVQDGVTPGGMSILATNAQVWALSNSISTIAGVDTTLLANAATQQSQINTFNANLGSFQAYANSTFVAGNYSNTNVSAYLSGQNITSANIGAFQTYANLNISELQSNASTQTVDINLVNANVTAANAAITSLQSNAATQAGILDTLTANAATQSTVLDTLISNAATQASTLTTLLSNAATQQTSLTDLLANAATQADSINTLQTQVYANANVEAYIGANIGTLHSNAATQSTAIATLQTQIYANANVATYLENFDGVINFTASPAVISGLGNISSAVVWAGNLQFSNGTYQTTAFSNTAVTAHLANFGSGNITTTGNVTGNTAGFTIGYRDIPQVSFTGNATLAATDAGKHYYSTLATANVLTIANNTSVSWSVGTAVTIVNRGSGNITVAQGSGVSLYLAGNSTASNRTVTTYGMATLLNVAANVWMINGTGVS